jgi:hypothetical protein
MSRMWQIVDGDTRGSLSSAAAQTMEEGTGDDTASEISAASFRLAPARHVDD